MTYRTILAALLSIWTGCAYGQSVSFSLPSDLEKQVDDLYSQWMAEGHPGAAVGIVYRGETVLAKGYGLASLEHQIPFTPETVSDIGSVAKQMTCFGIVLLSERNELSLEDDIRKYLPEVPDFGRPITIQHLMNHTSGLREIYATESIRGYRPGDGILQEDALRLVTHSRELNFRPGEQYRYCNTGYMLLADIISRVSGQPFENWMQENVFQPLGMNHTYIMDRRGGVFPNCADSYGKNAEGSFTKIYDNSTVQGAGGVYTTLTDLLVWLKYLRAPEGDGKTAVAQMLRRGVLNNGDTLNYALGLTVDRYRGLRRIQHTGSSAGYRALLTYFPEVDMGVVVKTNCPAVARMDLVDTLLAPVLEPAPPVTEPVPASAISPPLLSLQAYSGFYFSDELETFYRLAVKNGELTGSHFRHGEFRLQPTEEPDVFETEAGFLTRIRFVRDASGAVTGLQASNGGVLNLWMVRME